MNIIKKEEKLMKRRLMSLTEQQVRRIYLEAHLDAVVIPIMKAYWSLKEYKTNAITRQ